MNYLNVAAWPRSPPRAVLNQSRVGKRSSAFPAPASWSAACEAAQRAAVKQSENSAGAAGLPGTQQLQPSAALGLLASSTPALWRGRESSRVVSLGISRGENPAQKSIVAMAEVMCGGIGCLLPSQRCWSRLFLGATVLLLCPWAAWGQGAMKCDGVHKSFLARAALCLAPGFQLGQAHLQAFGKVAAFSGWCFCINAYNAWK